MHHRYHLWWNLSVHIPSVKAAKITLLRRMAWKGHFTQEAIGLPEFQQKLAHRWASPNWPHVLECSTGNHWCKTGKNISTDWWGYLGVSWNGGTTKPSILIGDSLIDHPFWGTSIYENPHFLFGLTASLDVWSSHVFPTLVGALCASENFIRHMGSAKGKWFKQLAVNTFTILLCVVLINYVFRTLIYVFVCFSLLSGPSDLIWSVVEPTNHHPFFGWTTENVWHNHHNHNHNHNHNNNNNNNKQNKNKNKKIPQRWQQHRHQK